ncbi:DNA-binding transcriptional LysR family regulator [Rahnella sp. BIGb0603]|uniref:LysR family transcriptional regulator n=1 Tax=Rahnella sp. BIGb0603 TaxID=2940612 RepID=UPI00216A8499|nr:LysR family transcriptional regulator [Rahnella sp. BIGb0603]MCS3425725.1 DNA-binding transcriptional LysR family regulator [Rahnella sp. BIGb0603]
MDKLRNIEVFVSVVETGNFSTAAEKLGISAVMVGKHIQLLEKHLNARLLQRTTRRQSLTDAGEVFYENGKRVLEQMKLTESAMESLQSVPTGLLRVSAPVSLGSGVIAPMLARYLNLYPQVKVELVLSNARVDLIGENFDLAIRIGEIGDDRLVARPLKPYEMVICASPEYLQRNGTPESPEDLKTHPCLIHSVWNQSEGWHLANAGQTTSAWPVNSRYVSNDGHALRNAALEGAGLLLQPKVLLAEDILRGRLIPVLESFIPTPRAVHVVYLPDFRPRAKLNSLINYMTENDFY